MENEENKIELRSEELQEMLGAVPPWILRWGITLVAIIALILLIGSSVFRYPDVIHSSVKLTSTVPMAGVVARTSGKICSLYVKDNQYVKKNDYLAIIDNAAETENILYLKNYLFDLKKNFPIPILLPEGELHLGSIQSLYSSFYSTLMEYKQFTELNHYQNKIISFKERIRQNEEYYNNMLRQEELVKLQFEISRKQHKRDSVLTNRDVMSKSDFELSSSRFIQSRLSLENMNNTLDNLRIQIAQMYETLQDTEYQYTDKKNSLENQLHLQVNQLLNEIHNWEMNYVLVSPIEGNIVFTDYWVENQNIAAGQEVFNIIPIHRGKLIGKATLPPERSGKVKAGQKVNIRFGNFPDKEYGTVKGVIGKISLVPSKNETTRNYIVEISLPDGLKTSYKKELPFLPEMEGQADIITDDLTVLQRIIQPIRKIINESIQ